MIPVHRLTHPETAVWLNSDLIQTIETTPDTVVSLTSHERIVVQETPEQVVALVQAWRAGIIARAGRPEALKKVVALPIT
jgi:flagellar protein FlbD